ncbi:MAG TPA: ferrochelatase [Blastocatellia bacterium]|jgi:ferrochelatase|nr:ferrochelatase [Blastocatellia bacterium]
MKLGVLLFNMGGPETLADVRPFLFNLFSDPEIVRLPVRAMQKPLAWLISTTRHKKSSGYYAQIGGGSPLRRITEEQAAALRGELARRNVKANVYVGMRYWRPYAEEAVDHIVRDGIDELVLLPLYPQFSVSTTGSSFKDFDELMAKRNGFNSIWRHYVPQWHTHQTYIKALAEQIAVEIEKFPDPDPRHVHLLFSAHSVPQSYIERGDPYLQHTEETVQLVSERLGGLSPVHLSFQSKVGPVKWLEPSTDAKLRELASKGVEQILAIPISFVSDHIETLYELDILYKKLADEIDVKVYRRLPALNCDPTFIRALADIVCEKLQ